MGSVSLIPLRGSENEMRRSVAAFTADPLSVSGSDPGGQGWVGPGWMPDSTSLISLRAHLVPSLGFWGPSVWPWEPQLLITSAFSPWVAATFYYHKALIGSGLLCFLQLLRHV